MSSVAQSGKGGIRISSISDREKRRSLDVPLILRQSLTIAAPAALGLGAYMLLSLVSASLFKIEIAPIVLALSIGLALLVVYVIFRTRGFAARQIDHLFYRDSYRYRRELEEFARKRIRGHISLDEFGNELLALLCGALKCHQSYLLLPRQDTGDFYVRFAVPFKEDRPAFTIKGDSAITQWLQTRSGCLATERLSSARDFAGLRREESEGVALLGIKLLFPILSRQRLIGVLSLGEKMVKAKYTREEISLCEWVVNDVATTLEKEYLSEQLRRREQELSIINRLSCVISSSLNTQEVYDAFVGELKQVVETDFTAIATVEQNEIYFSALSSEVGSAWDAGQKIPFNNTAVEWVFINRTPYYEKNLSLSRQFKTAEEYAKLGIRSLSYVPLINKGEVNGVLIVGSRKPAAYSAEQIALLERLCAQIAAPIENSRLYARAEAAARVDAITGLFNRRHFDERLREEIARRNDYGDTFSLMMIDMDNFKKYNDGFGHMAGDRVLVTVARLIEGLIRSSDTAFRYGGDEFVVILPHASALDAFRIAERIRDKVNHEYSLKQPELSISIGVASWPGDGATLDELCYAADMALYYAKHTGQNRTCTASKTLVSLNEPVANTNSEADVMSTIYALAATLEARDKYTYGHSRRVSRYAVATAEALNLPPEQVAVISAASLLHDIGKVGIPDNILNKSGKLLEEEWELLKQHPRLSATIVEHIPSLSACLAAVRHHHERWDGSGYPSGLKGEEIPIEARILCVTDAFEAMISDRPYRGRLSFRQAIAELENCSGSQFDPDIVRVFIPIILATSPDELEMQAIRNSR